MQYKLHNSTTKTTFKDLNSSKFIRENSDKIFYAYR